MRPLKILQVMTHSDITRGGAFQSLLLAKGLKGLGHDVVCYLHSPVGLKAQEVMANLSSAFEIGIDFRLTNMKNPLSYLNFRRFIKEGKFDVIHAHRNLALVFSYFSALNMDIPAFVANRGTTFLLPNPFVRHVFNSDKLDHVIAVAKAVKDILIEREVLDPEKISVIYGSYDERRFRPDVDGSEIREEFECPLNAPLIGSIAAIDKRKGLEFLVRAAPKVLDRYPEAKFLIVGTIASKHYCRSITSEINRLGLQGKVIMTGHRKDIPEIISALDISISTSIDGEGLTGALRESLAMKKPVICTRVCGNPELVVNGQTGTLIPPGDPDSISEAILRTLNSPERAREMAHKGHELVRCLSNNEDRCKKIEGIYLNIIKRKRNKGKGES